MNPMWKVYKSKVMKTLNPDMEDDPVEEVSDAAEDMTPIQQDDAPSSMSQLAKRMQGASVKGWKSVSGLFNKDDEHQLLEAETENQPVADHPLAMKPEEPPRPNKRTTGFWDNFATKWHQAETSVASVMEEDADGSIQEVENETGGRGEDGENQAGQESGAGEGGVTNSFSKYATLGGEEDTPTFKWNFVTSKLADLKSRSMAKSN
ncbi:hypothetical protein E1301_Tti011284 [Triplophysa tibetana]|uniref:Testis development-related protein n=1 Tax=Triplophysa tibetana TaxID=1572043 RepID=A0A5A9MZ41_9TELE|nr:hypothetical protein E1301_Tti011284 [Triplophysa tibetana]